MIHAGQDAPFDDPTTTAGNLKSPVNGVADSKSLPSASVFAPNSKTIEAEVEKVLRENCDDLNLTEDEIATTVRRVRDFGFPGMPSEALHDLIVRSVAAGAPLKEDFDKLAVRLELKRLHENTPEAFFLATKRMHDRGLASHALLRTAEKFQRGIAQIVDYGRDRHFDYFGLQNMIRMYLRSDAAAADGIARMPLERPQHLYLRMACTMHPNDWTKLASTYEALSRHDYVHGSPTMFNCGSPSNQQLSSCFLVDVPDDSPVVMMEVFAGVVKMLEGGGGVGLNFHCVPNRSFVTAAKALNECLNLSKIGGKRLRPSAIAVYVEPWHMGIHSFLKFKKQFGSDESRAQDLFYGLWIPDLFMERVEEDKAWTLFDPKDSDVKNLSETWGVDFETLYEALEKRSDVTRETIGARQLWSEILQAQMLTGVPYMLFKDACNRSNMLGHLGTVKNSNLCAEIVQRCSENETSVCNIATVSLPSFVVRGGGVGADATVAMLFDFQRLRETVQLATENLNRVIDLTSYPDRKAENFNVGNRPIGIGVNGLADVFLEMQIPFESRRALDLNLQIFEVVYFAALEKSCQLAKRDGTFDNFASTPYARGTLHHDFFTTKRPSRAEKNFPRLEWSRLRAEIAEFGLRNGLLTCQPPTATTATVLGNTESIEPLTANIYNRRTIAGEFAVVNRRLRSRLSELGIWNKKTIDVINKSDGSVAFINEIPAKLKMLYRTVWEIDQDCVVQMAIDRAPYIDQSQSLNISVASPDEARLTELYFKGWKGCLKTGLYYLRTKPDVRGDTFAIPVECRVGESCESCAA